MPRDLPDLLGDALPRDTGAPDLGAIESRVARRRAGRLGGAVLALAAAVAIGAQVLPSTAPAPMIDQVEDTAPAGTTVVPLPPAGEVTAAHANGRPVFVVHDDDGEVRVLDGVSPHPGEGMQGLKVLAYCSRSGWFEDLWHGSKFAGNGAWVGGPAPFGLAEHTVVSTTAETVTVGAMTAAPTRRGLDGEEPTGEGCTDVIGDNEDYAALVLHDPAAEGAVPGLLYPEVRDGEVVLPDEPQVPLAGPDVTLPLPAPGEINADHVNGRPVFVRNRGDGNVLVLDAVNPHVTEFGPKVLAWCRRLSTTTGAPRLGGGPVDLWYGSHFTDDGVAFGTGAGGVLPGGWVGGPAPTGLGWLPVRTVTPGTVTVAGSPLPPPPRVGDGDDAIGNEECSESVALFPGGPAADPAILDDLVLHEPLFEDDWWYPTPARILGEEPGLPPDELERYREEITPDLVELELDDLPVMGGTGLVVPHALGVEFLDLDGTSHGLVRDVLLLDARRPPDGRDGHGGPVLLSWFGAEYWADPASGTSRPATDTTVLQDGAALTRSDGGAWEAIAAGGTTSLPAPLRVANGHRVVSGPDCLMTAGRDCVSGGHFLDVDVGGTGTTPPGCNVTDAFGDFGLLFTCWLGDDAWLESTAVGSDGASRIEMPRYPGQPADQPTVGHFNDAVFGGPGVVAELSLECEVTAVVGLEADGTAVDPWGSEAWSDGPVSTLLGTTVIDGTRVVLAQVPGTTRCGEPPSVPAGIWAIGDGGEAVHLNGIATPVALWTDVGVSR